MKREDCWMSFSEALESYFEARMQLGQYGNGQYRDGLLQDIKDALAHMDALTESGRWD